ncbi:three-Cys-motif partner protein TcmP [Butyrivibrio hungatei]|uniref:three-Cys-motif partner protein TcmP n=1 Tax=Butyrivibrio hungatei TaxID=185008 RepID=UPI00048834D9|nr:three-Cys-motif partner protein TcmP [Butyrivibrio hungatei]
MASSKAKSVISVASKHTIKKFEIISKYVEAWAEILLSSSSCNGIVYIDCMSNSGLYRRESKDGEVIEGTALLVANILAKAMKKYKDKQAYLYFNDIDENKIDLLNTKLPKRTENFNIQTFSMDASELLNKISSQFKTVFKGMNFLLVYDPYDANIDWEALMPFLRNWGEVIINHMVSDTIRAARVAKKKEVINKYERTYQTNIEELITFGNSRESYELKVQSIIKDLCGRENRYYVASFPFFNNHNSVVYDLIHCTGHHRGFDLYKEIAWKTFGDKSSDKKKIYNDDYGQLTMNFETGETEIECIADGSCYTLKDIAGYIQKKFRGQTCVPKGDVIAYIYDHPVFPTRNYRNKIWDALKKHYGAEVRSQTITFSDRSY